MSNYTTHTIEHDYDGELTISDELHHLGDAFELYGEVRQESHTARGQAALRAVSDEIDTLRTVGGRRTGPQSWGFEAPEAADSAKNLALAEASERYHDLLEHREQVKNLLSGSELASYLQLLDAELAEARTGVRETHRELEQA